jgi:crotonobetainyl-CoA:carnitine CoA-transferase CaiB-like acyl-CoA transferase
LAALDLEHLKQHPDLQTNADRFEARTLINQAINQRTRSGSVAHWIDRLNAAGVPCGRVLGLAEVFDDPQTKHQQMRVTIEHPQHGALDVLGFPIKFTDAPCTMHRPPPVLGADTESVLHELGYKPEAFASLRAAGVI